MVRLATSAPLRIIPPVTSQPASRPSEIASIMPVEPSCSLSSAEKKTGVTELATWLCLRAETSGVMPIGLRMPFRVSSTAASNPAASAAGRGSPPLRAR